MRVDGQFVCNGTSQKLSAALSGLGLAYVPEDVVAPHVAKGKLKRVSTIGARPYAGYHLY